jgi:sarcosine oxidase subunit gamma
MSPDEVLLLCDYDAVDGALERVSDHLHGQHVLVADVSDARVALRLSGPGSAVRETLAKLTPADMRARAFPVGKLRRTHLSQVPAAIWFEDDGTAIVLAFRSVADYVFDLLSNAAESDVGYF